MIYLEMGLSLAAEFLAILPAIPARRTAGCSALCLAGGTALWFLEWHAARPLPGEAAGRICETCPRQDRRDALHTGGLLLYIPVFWALLSQAAVFLRLTADLLAETVWPGVSAASLCPAVFLGTMLLTLFWHRKRELCCGGRSMRPAGAAAAFGITAAAVLPAAVLLSGSIRAAGSGSQEFAVISAAADVLTVRKIIPGKAILIFLLLSGLFLSSAVSYLGLQKIIASFVPLRIRSAVSGLWPVCIIIPLLLAVGFRSWTSLIGWYAAYSVFTLAPAAGIFFLFRLYFQISAR